jgi:hypothetical protein
MKDKKKYKHACVHYARRNTFLYGTETAEAWSFLWQWNPDLRFLWEAMDLNTALKKTFTYLLTYLLRGLSPQTNYTDRATTEKNITKIKTLRLVNWDHWN